MAHKRNGREAKKRRQVAAELRKTATDQFRVHYYTKMTSEERFLCSIFGAHEDCVECGNNKLIGTDCQTPHCKAIREEPSAFYDEVTDDHIKVSGATMEAGVDY